MTPLILKLLIQQIKKINCLELWIEIRVHWSIFYSYCTEIRRKTSSLLATRSCLVFHTLFTHLSKTNTHQGSTLRKVKMDETDKNISFLFIFIRTEDSSDTNHILYMTKNIYKINKSSNYMKLSYLWARIFFINKYLLVPN